MVPKKILIWTEFQKLVHHLLPTHRLASAARSSAPSLTVDAAAAVATKYASTRISCGCRRRTEKGNRAPSDALQSYRRRNATTVLRLAAGPDQIRRSRPLEWARGALL